LHGAKLLIIKLSEKTADYEVKPSQHSVQ